MVSGSADKDVKFWDFEMREEGEGERVVSRLGVETIVRLAHRTTFAQVLTITRRARQSSLPWSMCGR